MNTVNQQPIDPILLIGAQRSGTTALGCALSAAVAEKGGIFTVNGKLLYYLKRWWLDDTADRHFRAEEIVYSLGRRKPIGVGIDEWLIRAEFAVKLSAKRIAELGPAVDRWDEVRNICRGTYADAKVWGDKYNEYLLDLEFLEVLFPNATWIFVVRDPHQVVASMMEWSGSRPWNPDGCRACALK